MDNVNKTKEQLLNELAGLRRRITELEALEAARKRGGEESKLKAEILDSATDSVFLQDFDGNFIYVNETAYKSRGYSREELMRINLAELDTPEYAKLIEPRIRELMEKGQIVWESAHLRKDKSAIPVEIHVRIVELAGRKLVLTVARDITDRKRLEQQYRTIIQTSMDAFWMADTQGHILDVNEAYCRLTGYNRDELLTMSIQDLEEVEEAQQTAEHIQRVIETGHDRFETRHRCKDGKVVDIEVSVNHMDAADGILFVFLRDITQRKRLEQRRAHLASFPELNPNPVLEVDSDGNVKYLNPAAKRVFPDLDILAINHPLLANWEQVLIELKSGNWNKPIARELKVRDSFYMQTISPVGGARLIRIYAIDITNRKQTEERLERLNRVLRTIRNINQLITQEKDRSRLLQGICERFIDNRGFRSAWITLLDSSRKLITSAEAGIGKDFLPLLKQLEVGSLPYCIRQALAQSSTLIIANTAECDYEDCLLPQRARGYAAMSRRLECQGEVYGVLAVSAPQGVNLDEEEQALFKEVTQDIAFALRMVEFEEKHQQAVQALQKSEDRYQDLYENAPIPYLSMDTTGQIVQANRIAHSWLGYTSDELVGKQRLSIYAEECRAKASIIFERFRRGELIRDEEMVYLSKDGQRLYGLLSATPIRDENDRIIASRSVVKDITERKLAEDALRASEEKYRFFVQNFRGIAYQAKWRTYRPFLFEGQVEQITGYPPELFLSGELVWNQLIHPDDQAMVEAESQRLATPGYISSTEYRIRRKDGVIRWVSDISGLTLAPDGSPAFAQGAINDITERKRTEEALRESEARFRRVSSVTSDIAYSCLSNQDGVYSLDWISGATERITGYKTDEIEAQSCWHFLVVDEDLPLFEKYVTGLPPGQSASCELRIRHKNGGIVWVTSYAQCVAEPKTLGCHRLYGGLVNITQRKRADEAVMASEQRYRLLVENVPSSVYIVQEGKITFANQQVEELTGYSLEELQSMNPFDVIHTEDRATVQDYNTRRMRGEPIPDTYSLRIIRKDGSVRWLDRQVVSVVWDGKPSSLVVDADTTERKQAEEAVRRAEQNFRNSLDNSPIGIRIVNADGKTLYANRALLDIYGYDSLEELNATPTKKRYSSESYAEHRERKRKRERGEFVPDDYVISIIRKSGEARHLEVFRKEVRWNGETETQVLYHDVTERKQAEEKLRQSEAKYATLVERGSDGIVIIQDGLLKFANTKILEDTGFTMEEVADKPFLSFIAPTDREIVGERYRKRLAGKGVPGNYEAKIIAKDGREIQTEISASIIDYEGKPADMAIIRDITERKRMEERLVVTDRLASIGELASGLAHELNNPLTGVIGFSEILMKRDLPEDAKEEAKMVYREAQRTAEVVKNLLTFARKHPPLKQMVDINTIIEKVLELRAYEQRVNNIQVVTNLAADLPESMADYFQLQQVFLNITINAEYFMTEAHSGGTLTIGTRKDGQIIRVFFTDDGPGIAPQALGHIFDPFFTTKPAGRGTGLGLSICHGIVSEHSGKIYAESQPGKGATFVIELPVSGPSQA